MLRTSLAATVATLALACAARAEIADAQVVLNADGDYDISWTADGPVDVYLAADPEAAPADADLVSQDDADGRHQMARADEERRAYFLLVEDGAAPVPTALRLLPLEGGRNFRDLGGYETEDGRRVKWGVLYRSGVMNGLTANDYAYLSGLGIRTVCDFRANEERVEEPTDWRAGDIDYVTFDYAQDSGAIAAAFTGDVSAEKSMETFKASYRQMPYEFAPRYADMFHRLAAGEAPLAFNCSAGKDRTGIAAALLLTMLGVPRETVVHDYSLSDDYVDFQAEFSNLDPDSPYAFLATLPPEVVAPFMGSDPQLIEAMFAQLEEDHGSVDIYVRDVLGVSDAEIEQIRALALE